MTELIDWGMATVVMDRHRFVRGDCLGLGAGLPASAGLGVGERVDLVFGSPPYEDKRTYGIGFGLTGDAWVRWTADRFEACLAVCRGLVAFVVDGKTERYRYSCAPELLIAELVRRGVCLRRPAYYARWGVPGSGGPDYLKARAETIIVGTRDRGRLHWADPTACGTPPKCPPGGAPSHRTKTGGRVNQTATPRRYRAPKRSNPGNIVDCGAVGGGNMGHPLAAQTEAPFPLKLAEFWVRSFCPAGGTVLDPFGGSGTTAHAAENWGRKSISLDIRESQVALGVTRLAGVVTEEAESDGATERRSDAGGEEAA